MWRQGYSRLTYPLTILPTIEGNLTFKKEPFGQADRRLILHFCKGKMDCYFDTDKEEYYYKFVLEKNLEDSDFMDKVEKKIKKIMEDLLNYSTQFVKKDLSNYSNEELLKMLNKFHYKYARIFGYGLVNTYDRDLVGYVKKYYLEKWVEKEGLDYFTILTSTTKDTYYEKERKDLLFTALKYKKKPQKDILNSLAGELERKYNWLYINYEGKLRNKKDFIRLIKETLKNNKNPGKVLRGLENKKKDLISKQKKLEKEINIDPEILRLSKAIRVNAYLREYRKPLAVKAIYYERFLLKEIASRLSITVKELKFLLPKEIEKAFIKDKLDRKVIRQRIKECVYDLQVNDYKVLVDDKAKELLRKIKEKEDIKKEVLIKGIVACPGIVKGKVYVVLNMKDGRDFKKGEIFIAPATSPELIQFLRKAKAIVTDEGGLTSHAAIVSRELNIPCIVGTKNATKILKNGNMIKVDAKKGIVNILK